MFTENGQREKEKQEQPFQLFAAEVLRHIIILVKLQKVYTHTIRSREGHYHKNLKTSISSYPTSKCIPHLCILEASEKKVTYATDWFL